MDEDDEDNEYRERVFRDRIAKEEDGKIEVICKSGRIDVLTYIKIIEVKTCSLMEACYGPSFVLFR